MWQKFLDWIFFEVLKLNNEVIFINIIHYIIYDFFKIIFLISIMMFLVAFVRSYVSQEKIKNFMKKNHPGINYLIASILGSITPFCSCSSIPLFMGFIKAGIPTGVAFAFLTTSPLVNEVLIVLMANYYGWKIALLYVLAGIALGITAGIIISIFKMGKYLMPEFQTQECISEEKIYTKISQRFEFAYLETMKILKTVSKFVFLGVLLGGIIHNFIPRESLQAFAGSGHFWAVPLAVLIGIPIYAGCSTVAPAIFSITAQGVPLGTSLALLMSIAGLSLPEALILKGAMKMRLLLFFFGVVAIGIILIGYLFNLFLI